MQFTEQNPGKKIEGFLGSVPFPTMYGGQEYKIITTNGEKYTARVDASREFMSEGLEWKTLGENRDGNIEKYYIVAWKWIQNKKNPAINDKIRIAEISVFSTEPDEVQEFSVDGLDGKLIHFSYEASFALLQSGSITSEIIPKLKQSCFLFDLDGTLVDTQEPCHAKAEAYVLKKYHNIEISPSEISSRFAGISTKEVFKQLVAGCDENFLSEKKWEYMYEIIRFGSPDRLPGITGLLGTLSKYGIPLGIASASPMPWIMKCIETKSSDWPLNMDKCFLNGKLCTSVDECKNGKPNPEVFLKTKQKVFAEHGDLKQEDFTIYVVGDGESDVLAGLAMGAKVLFLSEENKTFDKHPHVVRFSDSETLAEYVIKECI